LYTYVVLLTAKGEKGEILKGLDAGADDYLIKRFDAQQLHARLRVGQRILDLQNRLSGALKTSEFRATHDFLTGLYNRGALMELLEREMARCGREHTDLAVLIIDADYFKKINDIHGHLAGDQVLKHLSMRIRSALRSYDFLGRYGGEEFLIIAPNCNMVDAARVAERVRACVANNKLQIGLLGIDLTVSIAGCGKTRVEVDAVPRNSLVSTAQPDKKKVCVEKTSSSWMCSAT
jgi:diguanylate cyclase (GGDEF)-like protein